MRMHDLIAVQAKSHLFTQYSVMMMSFENEVCYLDCDKKYYSICKVLIPEVPFSNALHTAELPAVKH